MTIPPNTTPLLALAMAGALLQGCANKAGPLSSGPRVYAMDMNGGARTCEVTKPALAAGKVADATMKVGNDGGWCGLPVRNGGKPYDAGLLAVRAAHGKVFVHSVGSDTRIDYTPDSGFTGTDSFTVQLLPGEAGVRVAVTTVPK